MLAGVLGSGNGESDSANVVISYCLLSARVSFSCDRSIDFVLCKSALLE